MQFDLRTMAEHMGGVAWAVVILLFIMSMYSIAVAIERFWTFRQATQQSRKYAPEVARFLKQGKIKEAIDVSDGKQYKLSHLAKVLKPGLQEWQYQVETGEAEKRPRRRRRGGQARHPARHRGEPRRPQARPLRPRHHRRHRPLRRPLRHDLRHHQRVLGHGRSRARAVSRRSRPVSPRR